MSVKAILICRNFLEMDFCLPDNREPDRQTSQMPDHLRIYGIPFAQCFYKLFPEGEILSQVIAGIDYSIWLHHFLIQQKVKVHPNTPTSITTINYMLQGTIPCILKGAGEVMLEEGKCHLFYIPADIFHDADLAPGMYSCMHINFNPDHLIPVAEQYPAFGPLLYHAIEKTNKGDHQLAVDIHPGAWHILNEIVQCKLAAGERALFLEARIRDLLRLYIEDFNMQHQETFLHHRHSGILKKVEAYIDANLDKNINVEFLARIGGTSRAWLQRLFIRKYQKGVHQVVVDKRMKAGKNLLLNTRLSVSEIIVIVSDMTIASFSTAFKKYYGHSPANYRKMHSRNQKK